MMKPRVEKMDFSLKIIFESCMRYKSKDSPPRLFLVP